MTTPRHRTLIRFESVQDDTAFAVVPANDPSRTVAIPLADLPDEIKAGLGIVPFRCYAYVFLDAEMPEELKPDRWHTGEPPLSPHAQFIKEIHEIEDRHAFAEIDRLVAEAELDRLSKG